jgi:hypothetical protein
VLQRVLCYSWSMAARYAARPCSIARQSDVEDFA